MSTYRFLFKPKWLGFHLLVIILVVVMVNLGFWQLHRLESRREFNAEVRARSAEPVVPIETIVTDTTDPADVQWRTVTVTGSYLPDEQVVIVNRAQEGITGVNVVTPMELADGRLVLINRGFVPDTEPVPPPTSGQVEVTGRLRETQKRSLGGLTEADGELTELFRVDIPRLAEQLPGPVVPVYVDLLSADPAQGSFPIRLPDPELSEGSHLSYMFQWWIFSVCAIVGWVLAVRRSLRQHRKDLEREVTHGGGRTSPDSPLPADVAATTAPD
jgi:cytochrome oxidase assembly protein ShyY1